MLVDYACILKYLKLVNTSSQKTSHQTKKTLCVWQLVFWLLVVLSNYYTQFHDFLHDYSVFWIPWFFHAWNFFMWLFRFSMIPRACWSPTRWFIHFLFAIYKWDYAGCFLHISFYLNWAMGSWWAFVILCCPSTIIINQLPSVCQSLVIFKEHLIHFVNFH